MVFAAPRARPQGPALAPASCFRSFPPQRYEDSRIDGAGGCAIYASCAHGHHPALRHVEAFCRTHIPNATLKCSRTTSTAGQATPMTQSLSPRALTPPFPLHDGSQAEASIHQARNQGICETQEDPPDEEAVRWKNHSGLWSVQDPEDKMFWSPSTVSNVRATRHTLCH